MTKLQGLTTIINQLPELYIKTPFLVTLTTYRTGVGRGCCQLKTNKTNEMKLPTCSFSLRGPFGPRLLRTRMRPPSSFVFTQPEGGYHSRSSDEGNNYRIAVAFKVYCSKIKRIGTGDNLITSDPLKINFSYET